MRDVSLEPTLEKGGKGTQTREALAYLLVLAGHFLLFFIVMFVLRYLPLETLIITGDTASRVSMNTFSLLIGGETLTSLVSGVCFTSIIYHEDHRGKHT